MIKKYINNKIYSFNFGLGCFILQDILSKIDRDKAKNVLFCEITQQSEELIKILSDKQIQQIIVQTFKSSFLKTPYMSSNNSFEALLDFLSSQELLNEVDQLYKRAVGEINISPTVFWNMTPKEIELAYLGYIKRKELDANCALAGARQASGPQDCLISLLNGKQYGMSSIQERQETFKILDIS